MGEENSYSDIKVLTMPEPLQRLQVSGLVPGGTPVPPKNEQLLENT